MNKQKGLLIGGGIVVAIIGGIVAYNAFAKGGGEGDEEVDTTLSQIKRPDTKLGMDISAEEATALMAEANGENPLYDLYRCYYDNNMIFLDKQAPCNLGSESLQAFIERFSSDKKFQATRTKILEGGMAPDFNSISLAISEPDSTNFFGAWSNISDNEASFCHGWLGSEMLEEFTFTRNDSSSQWILTDYFSALYDIN